MQPTPDILSNFFCERPPIQPRDSFLVYDRVRKTFNFPVHYHSEYELNYIVNSKGVRRIVGNHIDDTDYTELVFLGPNLLHSWETHNCKSKKIHEITIQFHQNLYDDALLSREMFLPLKDLFVRSRYGILFSVETCEKFKDRLMAVPRLEGIQYFTEITSLLHDLSLEPDQKELSNIIVPQTEEKNDLMNKINAFLDKNYGNKITLEEAASVASMSINTFNRFIYRKTNKTFVNYLNSIRINYAARWLIEKDFTISEIAYMCGFNNLANFNRIFKASLEKTPSEYKAFFLGRKKII